MTFLDDDFAILKHTIFARLSQMLMMMSARLSLRFASLDNSRL